MSMEKSSTLVVQSNKFVESMEKNSALVVQSNKLVESRYTLTVGEQRLVFAVASMIHPDDIDFFPYEIKIPDLAALLNIDVKNAYRDADKITDQLMSRFVVINEEDGPLKVGWVSSCKYNNKKGSISFRFDPSLKPYLIQLKRDFTKSKLTILTQFQSIYSIRIYQLLKQYKKIGYREFSVDELKEILGIDKNKYKQFKQFRQWVLNQAKKEFEMKDKNGFNKCDLTFKLETIREDRKIDRIKFIIIPQSYQESLPLIENVKRIDPEDEIEPEDELLERIEYYGVTSSVAKRALEDHGVDKVLLILNYYDAQLAAGKVEKKGGAFLAYLLKEGISGKSSFEIDKEKAIEVQRKSRKESERKQKEEVEKRFLKLESKFFDQNSEQQQEIIEQYKKSLPNFMLKSFEENGWKAPQFKEIFLDFTEQFLQVNS